MKVWAWCLAALWATDVEQVGWLGLAWIFWMLDDEDEQRRRRQEREEEERVRRLRLERRRRAAAMDRKEGDA